MSMPNVAAYKKNYIQQYSGIFPGIKNYLIYENNHSSVPWTYDINESYMIVWMVLEKSLENFNVFLDYKNNS